MSRGRHCGTGSRVAACWEQCTEAAMLFFLASLLDTRIFCEETERGGDHGKSLAEARKEFWACLVSRIMPLPRCALRGDITAPGCQARLSVCLVLIPRGGPGWRSVPR